MFLCIQYALLCIIVVFDGGTGTAEKKTGKSHAFPDNPVFQGKIQSKIPEGFRGKQRNAHSNMHKYGNYCKRKGFRWGKNRNRRGKTGKTKGKTPVFTAKKMEKINRMKTEPGVVRDFDL